MKHIELEDVKKSLDIISDYFKVNPNDVIYSKCKIQPLCNAKFCLTYLMHTHYNIPTSLLMDFFNLKRRGVFLRCYNVREVYYYSDMYNELIKKNPQLLEDEGLKKYMR